MRIAIVGGGVTGLVAAHHLHRHHQIDLYEAADRLGGHAHTVDVEVDGRSFPVDTGFIVCNERTYPRFTALLDRLDVDTVPSEMSLSVADEDTGVEWGTALGRLRARPTHGRSRVSPVGHVAHTRVLAAIPRWHRAGTRLLEELDRGTADTDETLADFLDRHRLPRTFGEAYVVPLTAAVWSADPTTVLDFPAATICRFLRNHGMLSLGERPQWRTVVGGSRAYVDAISASYADRVHLKATVTDVQRTDDGVALRVDGGEARTYDAVVLAVHAPTALAMVADADDDERSVVGAVRTQPNPAVLHTDRSVLPRHESVWSSWNVQLPAERRRAVAVTYLMNRLQPLPVDTPVCVSLNRDDDIDPDTILGSFAYAHPVLDGPAVRAQAALPRIQGRGGVWWAGAWAHNGFHEDGVRSAEQVCERIDPGVTRG